MNPSISAISCSGFPSAMDPSFASSDLRSSNSSSRTFVSRIFDESPDFLLTSSQEHVLRSVSNGSSFRNFNTARTNGRHRSASIITNPYEGYEKPPNDDFHFRDQTRFARQSKYSPTPSIKRGKAERLLKEHGSPPGCRVTAGGRIVPDGLSPLTSPRFNYNFPALNKYHLNHNPGNHLQTFSNGLPQHLNGLVTHDINANLCQIVDGELKPVEVLPNGHLRLYMSPTNPASAPLAAGPTSLLPQFLPPAMLPVGPQGSSSNPYSTLQKSYNEPTTREMRLLEAFHANLERELKDLDRTEVLQRGVLDDRTRARIVTQRIDLVNRIDESRRAMVRSKQILGDSPPGNTRANFPRQHLNAVNYRLLNQEPIIPIATQLPYFQGRSEPLQQVPFGMNAPSNQQYPLSAPPFQTGFHVSIDSRQGCNDNQRGLPHRMHFVPGALHEHPGNVGLGIQSGPFKDGDHKDTYTGISKTEDTASTVIGSINLDGSAHQSRRSHAVEIKNPNHLSVNTKLALNPTSPVYRPANLTPNQSNDHHDEASFMPSPTLVAQIQSLVQSPASQPRGLEQSHDQDVARYPSDSSVSTTDFFPNDTHQYSSTKQSPVRSNSASTWLPTARATKSEDIHSTPGRLLNKFTWDDSPEERLYSNQLDKGEPSPENHCRANLQQRPYDNGRQLAPEHERHSCDMDFITQASFAPISPETHRQQSALLSNASTRANISPSESVNTEKGPIAHILQKVNEKAALLDSTSPPKSDSYWEGFNTGFQQDVMTDNKDDDYRLGYRDGLIRSTTPVMAAAPFMVNNLAHNEKPNTPIRHASFARKELSVKVPSVSKTSILPSFNVPAAPANSLSNTPTRTARSSQAVSPLNGSFTDDTKIGFMSQPNVNLNTPPDREVGTQTSVQQLRTPEPVSPLANRHPNQLRDGSGERKTSNFAARMQNRNFYDEQRYAKAQPTVAPSGEHARRSFPLYDGSADDDNALTEKRINSTPTSPSGNVKVKVAGSPVKAVSAAMAIMGQLVGRTKPESRNEIAGSATFDTTNNSSPEKKAKRRLRWKNNFETSNREEQEEIAGYKNNYPLK